MSAPVTLVTVHHEGAGTPTTAAGCQRFAHGGYTYGIGTDTFARFRDVWSSYATLNYNHVSLDLCLSGNRMTAPVTSRDIDIIRGAVTDARGRGFVIDRPTVRDHRSSPGSNTVCSGDNSRAVWDQIVAACQAGTPTAPSQGGGAVDLVRTPSGRGYYIAAADGGVFCYGDARFYGSMGGQRLAAPVVDIAVRPRGDGYWLAAADGGVFAFGAATFRGSMGGKKLDAPIVGIDCDAEGDGYWLLGADGGVFTFGATSFFGSAAGKVKYP